MRANSVRITRSLSAGFLAVFIAHLVSISTIETVPGVVANRHLSKRVSPPQESHEQPFNRIRQNEAVYEPDDVLPDVPPRRLIRQVDGRPQPRPGYKLIRVKAPQGRRRTTTTTTTPPPEDYYYYEVPEDEVVDPITTSTTSTRRPQAQQHRQRQRVRQPQSQQQQQQQQYQQQTQHVGQQIPYSRHSANSGQYGSNPYQSAPQQQQHQQYPIQNSPPNHQLQQQQTYTIGQQSQRLRPEPQRSRQSQRVRRPPQDYYEYNDLPSAEEENGHYGYNYATAKPRHQRPHQSRERDRDYRDRDRDRDRDYRDPPRQRYDDDDDDEDERPRKKSSKTTTTTTTTTTTSTEPPKPSTTLSPGYKERSDGRIIDYLADPNFPRELTGADLTEYPFYISVPDDIKFDCDTHGDGFFASVEHHCQLFHYCFGGYRYSFLCPNYTVYDQTTFTCRFINTVKCDKSKSFYNRNDALFKETTTTTTTTTTAAPIVEADMTIAKETAKALKRAKPSKSNHSKSKSTTTTTTTTELPPEDEEEEYYDDEYEDEPLATTTTNSPVKSKSKTPSTTPSTTTTTTTTTSSKPPPLLAGRKSRLNRPKLLGNRS